MKTDSKKKIAALKELEKNKAENIQKMCMLSFERLKELDDYYYQWYKDASERGFKESAEVNYKKWQQVRDSIEIKRGNEEQAWDYLT
ncbi:MAG TPA: hypothetical protein VI548_06805 [Chitinophagaceae bacterium]|nr:hypothetical protein [Chitinophagaceae bacterium]